MGCEAVTIVATPRFVDHEDADPNGNEPSMSPSYRKPTLRRLGAWNLFTRQGSPSTVDNGGETGFFEFDFGR
jgi:hypothetical protein